VKSPFWNFHTSANVWCLSQWYMERFNQQLHGLRYAWTVCIVSLQLLNFETERLHVALVSVAVPSLVLGYPA